MKKEIGIKVRDVVIKGILAHPEDSDKLVIFSHGSGSSRFSKRNTFVAGYLNQAGIATLLVDLLTEEEDLTYANRFDIDLLTDRLVEVTAHMTRQPEFQGFSVGYFGASTGAASALRAATFIPESIQAVVSRGGRPDLVAGSLPKVKAPTLLLVGGLDTQVITLNRRAYTLLTCEKNMEIIEGAGHLFEEPGKLALVAKKAEQWFLHHLQSKEVPALTHSKL